MEFCHKTRFLPQPNTLNEKSTNCNFSPLLVRLSCNEYSTNTFQLQFKFLLKLFHKTRLLPRPNTPVKESKNFKFSVSTYLLHRSRTKHSTTTLKLQLKLVGNFFQKTHFLAKKSKDLKFFFAHKYSHHRKKVTTTLVSNYRATCSNPASQLVASHHKIVSFPNELKNVSLFRIAFDSQNRRIVVTIAR